MCTKRKHNASGESMTKQAAPNNLSDEEKE